METVKGFKDITGIEAQKRERIREIIVKNFKLCGFEPAETPIIEYEKFVKGDNKQDGAISDLFKLKDKGKRKLALRYEFTFQLKRLSKSASETSKTAFVGARASRVIHSGRRSSADVNPAPLLNSRSSLRVSRPNSCKMLSSTSQP